MDIPCILFISNSRHYVITEDSVIASWPSRSDKESEIIQLNDGRIITANNVRRFNFIDISKIESLTAIDDASLEQVTQSITELVDDVAVQIQLLELEQE